MKGLGNGFRKEETLKEALLEVLGARRK